MRFPVFARRANPAIDLPIVRKKSTYLELQVREGLADWVDPCDPAKGIIAREYLPSGKAQAPDPVAVESLNMPRAELPGVRYVPPASDPRPRISSVRAGWDWSFESLNARDPRDAAIPA
jgi:hypothetical protein